MKFEILQSSYLEWCILGLFIISSAYLLFYYLNYFYPLLKISKTEISANKKPISVVIVAKDEYEPLKQNLPFVLEQNYPNFEVVLVVDGYDEDTHLLLKGFASRYPNLKIVNFEKNINFFRDKKFAVSLGIRSASHEHILLTSADCRPASTQWIDEMQSGFSDKKQIVLGCRLYEKKNGILNAFVRFDAFENGLQYLSAAKNSQAYTGIIQNVAYTKSLFWEGNGLTDYYNIESGDDDLFVNKCANATNVSIRFSPDSFVKTTAFTTLGQWFNHKTLHLKMQSFFKQNIRWKLILFRLFNAIFFFSFFGFIVMECLQKSFQIDFNQVLNLEILLFFFLVKTSVQLLLYRKFLRKIKEEMFVALIPFFEIFIMILQPFLAISKLFSKNRSWN